MSLTQMMNALSNFDNFPFVNVEAASRAGVWDGLFAFQFTLKPIDPELVPIVHWPADTIVQHIGGEPNDIAFSDQERWYSGVSVPGRVCFFPRDQPVQSRWTKITENLVFGISPDLLHQVALETRSGDPETIALRPVGLFDDALITQMGWTLLQLLQDSDVSLRLYAEALGVSIAHHLLYQHSADKSRRILPDPTHLLARQLKAALDYIHANYKCDLSLAEIAANANLSVAHFSRLFRQATGSSPHQYLIRCRVEQAYLLLQQRRHTLTEIAQRVGFYDESHLLRHFKRTYGTTPAKILLLGCPDTVYPQKE